MNVIILTVVNLPAIGFRDGAAKTRREQLNNDCRDKPARFRDINSVFLRFLV